MRRTTAVLLAIGAAASVAAAPPPIELPPIDLPPVELPPVDPQLPDDPNPFPAGVCVYARPVNPNTKYCVIVHDPR